VKVIWLNDELTDAIVEVGWFTKHYARVRYDSYSYAKHWRFKETNRWVGWFRQAQLRTHAQRERQRRADAQAIGKEWVTEAEIMSIPRAQLLLRKGVP